MSDPDFESVSEIFHDSLAYRMARPAIDRSVIAARESALLARGKAVTQPFTALTRKAKIEFVATAFAVASIAHLAIRALLPLYATSGLPWWWNVSAGILAALVAMMAGSISIAWTDSVPARLWRRLAA